MVEKNSHLGFSRAQTGKTMALHKYIPSACVSSTFHVAVAGPFLAGGDRSFERNSKNCKDTGQPPYMTGFIIIIIIVLQTNMIIKTSELMD